MPLEPLDWGELPADDPFGGSTLLSPTTFDGDTDTSWGDGFSLPTVNTLEVRSLLQLNVEHHNELTTTEEPVTEEPVVVEIKNNEFMTEKHYKAEEESDDYRDDDDNDGRKKTIRSPSSSPVAEKPVVRRRIGIQARGSGRGRPCRRSMKQRANGKDGRGRPRIYDYDPNLVDSQGILMSRYKQMRYCQAARTKQPYVMHYMQQKQNATENSSSSSRNTLKVTVTHSDTEVEEALQKEHKAQQQRQSLAFTEVAKENTELKKALAFCKSDTTNVNKKCDELEKQLQTLRETIQRQNEATISHQTQLSAMTENKLLSLATEVEVKKKIIESLQNENEELKKLISANSNSNATLTSFFQNKEHRMEAELKDQEAQLTLAKAEKQKLQEQLTSQQRAFEAEKNELMAKWNEKEKDHMEERKARQEAVDLLLLEKAITRKRLLETQQNIFIFPSGFAHMALPIRAMSRFFYIQKVPAEGMPQTPDSAVWMALLEENAGVQLHVNMFQDENVFEHFFCVVDVLTHLEAVNRPTGTNQNGLILSFSVVWIANASLAKERLKESLPQAMLASKEDMQALDTYLARIPQGQLRVAKKMLVDCFSESQKKKVESLLATLN